MKKSCENSKQNHERAKPFTESIKLICEGKTCVSEALKHLA